MRYMMATFLLLACFGIGCRGVEKKEEVPHEEPVVQPVVEELPIPEPAPIAEESIASPGEPVVSESEDQETVALRLRIAMLRERCDKLRERKDDVFTRIPARNDRRFARLERELAEIVQALDDASIGKKEEGR